MRFGRDEGKNMANVGKHTIGFAQSVPVFCRPLRKVYYDEKHSSLNEDRYIPVGFAPDSILYIIFTGP
jgi:uncharacterized DUF497 family protein